MKKTILIYFTSVVAFIFLAEINLVARNKDYQKSLASNWWETEIAYRYFTVRRKLISAKNPEYAISIAAHIARQPTDHFLSLMRNGGIALSILIPVSEDKNSNNKPFATQAAYEALVLLVRMPPDAEIDRLSDYSAKLLVEAIKINGNSGGTDEVFQIKEVLSMYAARKRGVAEILGGALDLPNEERAWRNDLATARIGMAACIQRGIAVPIPSRDALDRGFGLKWLGREAREGWDEALIQTVIVGNSSDDCKGLARRYESMVIFTK